MGSFQPFFEMFLYFVFGKVGRLAQLPQQAWSWPSLKVEPGPAAAAGLELGQSTVEFGPAAAAGLKLSLAAAGLEWGQPKVEPGPAAAAGLERGQPKVESGQAAAAGSKLGKPKVEPGQAAAVLNEFFVHAGAIKIGDLI